MPHQPETAVDRIPIGRSVNYAVRGVPEIGDEYNAERTITPTEITLVYRAAPDPQLGRVSAYVKGWWMQDGKRVPMDKPVGRWLYGDPECWPAWLAEEARLHDPDASSAGVAPGVWVDGHPQLEAIAAAVWEQCRTEDTSLVVDDPRNIAVAALAALAAVLPASVDRADVLREAAGRFDQHAAQLLDGIGDKAVFVAKALRDQAAVWSEAAETLRRLAGQAHAAQPSKEARLCPAKHGALGRICELPAGHAGLHTGAGENGSAVWDGDAP